MRRIENTKNGVQIPGQPPIRREQEATPLVGVSGLIEVRSLFPSPKITERRKNMLFAMSALLASALTVIAIVGVLAVLFYFMYHTFHGDLPGIMKLIVAIGLIIGAVMVVLSFI